MHIPHILSRRVIPLALALVLAGTAAAAAYLHVRAASIPAVAPVKYCVTVLSNAKAVVDASNLSEGFVKVRYTGGKNVRIKVQITKTGGTTYTYNLNNTGVYETFPLTEGDGAYAIKVYENTTGTKYAQAYSTSVTMTLRDQFLPFLYSNQYVNFTENSATVVQGKEITANCTTDLEKVAAIFNWVTTNFTYDYDLAANPPVGYLPVVDTVLERRKGICFDYSAVMSAMLRSQGIPCKLVIGYAGTVYHAWINVYIEGVGWVQNAIYFDGEHWTMMDPTFVSTGRGSASVMQYVTNPNNYSAKFAY